MAILDFVTGRPSAALDERVLKTVLFTDIVNSTELLSARGDAQWRHELDAHDKLVDSVLAKYGGSGVQAHGGRRVRAVRRPRRGGPLQGSNLRPRWLRVGSPFAPVFTWANASGVATSGAAWRCTSVPG